MMLKANEARKMTEDGLYCKYLWKILQDVEETAKQGRCRLTIVDEYWNGRGPNEVAGEAEKTACIDVLRQLGYKVFYRAQAKGKMYTYGLAPSFDIVW